MTTNHRKTLLKKIIFFAFFFSCLGLAVRCRRPDPEVKARVHAMFGEQVAFPDNLLPVPTACGSERFDRLPPGLKIVQYIDSMECTSCRMSDLMTWNLFQERIVKAEQPQVAVCVVIGTADTAAIRSYASMFDYRFRLYIDTCAQFPRLNGFIPAEDAYRTFLLDPHHRIALIGRPFLSPQSEALFNRKIHRLAKARSRNK